ncbi:Transposable element Tc3 transposase [Araneus ventricosus]|uniref:Transposable element Tc3 transposase n=1 Tax=Araneus ventricosus TaxID=182803 RepID=A0A4Y2LLQ7_ARAVE|nr:Transposable element Tc3 transposase [Araneus ventricosus]
MPRGISLTEFKKGQAIAYRNEGKTIREIAGRQNHKDYVQKLETELLSYGSDWVGENWIYQQDGASIHTAQGVKKWFDDNSVQVLSWPAKSPDLNIVENVWAMLVERVYGQGRQYENVKELHESLDSVWNTFCQKDIQNLYDSMPNRVFELIQAGVISAGFSELTFGLTAKNKVGGNPIQQVNEGLLGLDAKKGEYCISFNIFNLRKKSMLF